MKTKIIPPDKVRKVSPTIPKKKKKKLRKLKIGKNVIKKLGYITDLLVFPDKEITWLPFAIIKGYSIIKKFDINIIFTSTPRHSNLLAALVLKKLTKSMRMTKRQLNTSLNNLSLRRLLDFLTVILGYLNNLILYLTIQKS